MRKLVTLLAAIILAAFVGTVFAPTAHAQQQDNNCTDRNSALANLLKNYKEQPVATALASSGGVVEVLTSEGGVSWSIIITFPSGMTCLIAEGENWEEMTPVHGTSL